MTPLHSPAQQLPVTDNTATPHLGVFNDSLGGQDGIRRDNHFCQWLGRSGVYATTFNGAYATTSWVYIEGHTGNINGWKRWLLSHPGSKVVVAVQMFPAGGPTHAQGARGDFDTHFQAFATKIRNAGICDRVIIRLGWEFNGGWYPWGVLNSSAEDRPEDFAANFCRISQTMRRVEATSTTDPGKMPANLKFNWCGARIWNSWDVARAYPGNTVAATTSTGVSYPAYSGDDYVHTVGLDLYDTDAHGGTAQATYEVASYPWSEAVKQQAWTNLLGAIGTTNAIHGIKKWQKIAADHGKPMTFPEWGLSSREASDTQHPAGGLDNPFFMEKMHAYIHDPANNVEFACYYDTDANANGGSNCRISQFPGQSATIHPNAAEKFRQLFTPPLPNRTNIGSITATTSADGLNVRGAGAGYPTVAAGTADAFYFTSRDCSSLDMMQVQLTSASVTAGQGGLMVRQNTAAGAINAALFVSNGNLIFQNRTALNGATASSTVASGITYPLWLKLVRNGTDIAAYRSADGLSWTYAAGQILSSLSGTAQIGMAVSSGAAGTLNTVGVDLLDNPGISLGQESAITGRIIKDNADATGVTFSSTAWAASTDRPDYYGVDGRIAPPTAGAITATFNPGLSAINSGLHDVYLHWPTSGSYAYNAPITVNHAGGSTPLLGNQESGTMAWVYAGTYSLNASSNVVWGNSTTTAGDHSNTLIDAVMFVPLGSAGLPAPKTNVDVGSPTPAGSATYSGGVFTIKGGGALFGAASEQFQYVSQGMTSSGTTLIARVTGLTNTNSDAKAGIMFRAGTGASDPFMMISTSPSTTANPGGIIKLGWRSSTGSSTISSGVSGGSVAAPTAAMPRWFKVVKNGSVFTCFYANGTAVPTAWTAVGGAITVNVGSPYRAGMIVSSKNGAALATGTFDNVTP